MRLGGFSAEQVVFNELTTGASNDLKVASDLARKMVTQFGMSEKLGPLSYGNVQEAVFLGREMIHERNYSESVAQDIDREVRSIIDQALATATRIVTEKMHALKAVAAELIAKETLEQAEFYAIIGQSVPQQMGA